MILGLVVIVAVGGIIALRRAIGFSDGDSGVEQATGAIDSEGEQVTIDSSSDELVTSGSSARSNPVLNGAAAGIAGVDVEDAGFEDGETRNWTNYTVGETIGSWTVIEGDVDTHNAASYRFGTDSRTIDLNGFQPGAIEQIIDVIPGVNYTLTIDLAENQCNPPVKQMGVDWNGERISTLTVDLPLGEYRTYEVQLPPSSEAEASLVFRGIGGANCGVQIDEPSLQLDPTS